jgi:hypothetical protein
MTIRHAPCLEVKAAYGSNLFVGHRQNPKEERKEEREALGAGGGGARGNTRRRSHCRLQTAATDDMVLAMIDRVLCLPHDRARVRAFLQTG